MSLSECLAHSLMELSPFTAGPLEFPHWLRQVGGSSWNSGNSELEINLLEGKQICNNLQDGLEKHKGNVLKDTAQDLFLCIK